MNRRPVEIPAHNFHENLEQQRALQMLLGRNRKRPLWTLRRRAIGDARRGGAGCGDRGMEISISRISSSEEEKRTGCTREPQTDIAFAALTVFD